MRWLVFICLCLWGALPGSSAFAGDGYQPLTVQQMNELLPGQTIKGEYRILRERSQTFNFREVHYADGTTKYIEGAITENGKWYTLGERKVCYSYPENPKMLTSCFWVYKSSGAQDECYYGYGLNTMTPKGPNSFDDWTARWVVEGKGGSCRAPIG